MFDVERHIDECRRAVSHGDGQSAVFELVERAVKEPGAILASLGEPSSAGVNEIFVSDELTILNLVWGPHMTLIPHNHEMWAVVGIYTGREDNIFWRRLPDSEHGKLRAAGAHALEAGEVLKMGQDAIHSVTNPIRRFTGALHVYGGNFFTRSRSEWDPETLTEQPFDIEKNVGLFEASNRLLLTD